MRNTAEEKRIQELSKEIRGIKKHLTEQNIYMSNSDVQEEVLHLGELLTKKNKLTGLDEDAPFLYFDDGEWQREIEGFIGDPTDLKDIHHQPLKIGDTVGLMCEDGKIFPRLVMFNLLSQETIQERKAAKIKDFSQLDIYDARSACFTVSLRSPVEEYQQSIRQDLEMNL